VGDFNGDGFQDIVTATRTGTGAIRVFDGLTHDRLNIGTLSQINAFTGRAAHGAYVAVSDVNKDGTPDIIAGSGLGGGTVKVFDGKTGELLTAYTDTPFGTRYAGGIRVAGGDVNGDGFGDVITGQGSYGSKVKVSFGASGVMDALPPAPVEFTAGAPRLRDGIFITAADTTGDGIAEIIVGRGRAGSNAGASIGIFKLGGITPPPEITTIALSNKTYLYGARVAATDLNFDGKADIVVGAGPLGRSTVQFFDPQTQAELTPPPSAFTAFPSSRNLGVFTAAGAPPVPVSRT
jgi:hypothetical protein